MPSDIMDQECINICNAINKLSGLYTIDSCCGHGKIEYRIWFKATSLEVLPPLLYYFDICHCGFADWKVIVETDCGMSPVSFMIEGPIGEQAFKEAERIAELLLKESRDE
jgi:hypothetical protein